MILKQKLTTLEGLFSSKALDYIFCTIYGIGLLPQFDIISNRLAYSIHLQTGIHDFPHLPFILLIYPLRKFHSIDHNILAQYYAVAFTVIFDLFQCQIFAYAESDNLHAFACFTWWFIITINNISVICDTAIF